jgi:ribosomal protein S18 acetylase RimI-like enzyme
MHNTVIYRAATIEDAVEIAELTNIAADGLTEFLFADLVPDATTTEILRLLVEHEEGVLSYRKTEVAECDGEVVGIACTYPAAEHRITPGLEQFYHRDRLEALHDFYTSRVEGSLYLNTLAVQVNFRDRGIGSSLIDRAKQKAQKQGFSSLSLIVWANNFKAIRLYQRHGFAAVKSIKISPHPLLKQQGGCILMDCLV